LYRTTLPKQGENVRLRILLTAMALLMLATLPGLTDSGYADISAKDLKAAVDTGKVTLLDCNGTKSFQKGHIPGAINFETNSENLSGKLPSDKSSLIVAYCGGPRCNAYKKGAEAARSLGYTNVKHFSGGISGWSDADYSLEK
jgi:rhodanese-related sulfurtransferase